MLFLLRPFKQVIQMSSTEERLSRATVPTLQVLAATAILSDPMEGGEGNASAMNKMEVMMREFGIAVHPDHHIRLGQHYSIRRPELVVEFQSLEKEPGKGRQTYVRIAYQAPMFYSGRVLLFPAGTLIRGEHIVVVHPCGDVTSLPIPRIQDIIASMESCPDEEVIYRYGHYSRINENRFVPCRCWYNHIGQPWWERSEWGGARPNEVQSQDQGRWNERYYPPGMEWLRDHHRRLEERKRPRED